MKLFAAIDLGASSGRVAVGSLNQDSNNLELLEIKEVHRFKVDVNENLDLGLRWNWSKIVEEVKTGLLKGQELGEIVSIGIDTWAVDYGLIDSQGELIEDPYCYRDGRTDGLMQAIAESIGAEYIYSRTGTQFIFFNTAYQLYAARDTHALKSASTFLMLPDLLNFVFCGVQSNDITNASTTQLLNAHTGDWDWELIEKLEIPKSVFPPLHKPGYKVGNINGHGTLDGIAVVAVGSHDTASAVAGIPLAPTRDSAYISSGTWSLVGLELDSPVTDETARAFNITNEAGVADRIRFIKNVSGMWLLEESVRYWKEQGITTTPAELARDAAALPRKQIIDTNDPRFAKPGAMPERIAQYCIETNQSVPATPADFARCIFDSLAVAYAKSLSELMQASGRTVREINIVGGGSSNQLLNQLTADETGIPVIAGPVEATVMGNLIIQMMSAGLIASLEEGRELIARSIERKTFTPASIKI
jgi:rhamnulokinase